MLMVITMLVCVIYIKQNATQNIAHAQNLFTKPKKATQIPDENGSTYFFENNSDKKNSQHISIVLIYFMVLL